MRNLVRVGLLAACASASLLAAPVPAAAEEHYSHHVFHEREVGHFRGADRDIWLGGHWHHEWHNGRFGWWWFAGGIWYFYDTPIYPYPTVVSDVTVIEPMAAPPPPQGTTAPVYYYCDNPAGYYPNVATCSTPFRPVPAAPPPPSAVPPAPVAPH